MQGPASCSYTPDAGSDFEPLKGAILTLSVATLPAMPSEHTPTL